MDVVADIDMELDNGESLALAWGQFLVTSFEFCLINLLLDSRTEVVEVLSCSQYNTDGFELLEILLILRPLELYILDDQFLQRVVCYFNYLA